MPTAKLFVIWNDHKLIVEKHANCSDMCKVRGGTHHKYKTFTKIYKDIHARCNLITFQFSINKNKAQVKKIASVYSKLRTFVLQITLASLISMLWIEVDVL